MQRTAYRNGIIYTADSKCPVAEAFAVEDGHFVYVGDNEGLPKSLIFAGDNEIFYPDIVQYVENLKKDGVDVRFITGHGLFHIYPMFPIPEARKAFGEVKKEILE